MVQHFSSAERKELRISRLEKMFVRKEGEINTNSEVLKIRELP